MNGRFWSTLMLSLTFLVAGSLEATAQSFNSAIVGSVTDQTGAVIAGAELSLTSAQTAAVSSFTTGVDGLYRFGNLARGTFDLKVSVKGFRDFLQTGISLNINETVTVNVKMEVGVAVEQVEVTAEASPLNFTDSTVKQSINTDIIAELPLPVQGNTRSVANFVVLMPGVSTPSGNPFDVRINGGQQMGDEAVLDGVTMQQGLMSQSGMVSLGNDYPMVPEATAEISVLTSNYEPQYGSTTSAVITAVTKSGGNDFHGELHEYHRNTVLNARQWNLPDRPKDIENEFGGSIGGPMKLPGVWGNKRKTFFFFNFDDWTIRGGARRDIISIPTERMRAGDFSEWPFPVYDPDTTRANPGFNPSLDVGPDNLPYLRNQFMGCDGNTPNVICASDPRLQNSLAKQWLQHLPPTDLPGTQNNYISPVPVGDISGVDTDHRLSWDAKFDHYLGDKDHFSATLHYRDTVFRKSSNLPEIIASEGFITKGGQIGPWVIRAGWDRNFSPTLLNNLNLGYHNFRGLETCVDRDHAGELPQIPGVSSHASPPGIGLEDFEGMGCGGAELFEGRPTYVVNDLVSWVRGKHTIKFGGEYRKLTLDRDVYEGFAGFFNFSRLNTGLIGIPSGNSVASFLLEQVDFGEASFFDVTKFYMRSQSWNFHIGDTWRATPNLSINFGLRWDVATPSLEKWDHLAFFDPSGPNPGAGNRPGRMAWAGTRSRLLDIPYGAAGFGERHPEKTWYKGFSPRLGIAYTLNDKTVVRAGYGIFYIGSYYPGWSGGAALDGFSITPGFSGSLGGMEPAFLLREGLPQDFPRPPFIDASLLNGQDGPQYRPFDGNRLSYAQQWNLTLERQFTNSFYISAAYVGNKGTRLLSQRAPLNALNPNLLSMGPALFDEFAEGQSELNGAANPYPGWETQLEACAPSVAQALVPYPQYCSSLLGLNENAGNSTYHALQLKAEHRFSQGLWFLIAYTASKSLTDSDIIQSISTVGGVNAVISPYEVGRNKALAYEDVPQTLSLAFVYDLPFGKGKRFLSSGGVWDKVLGGWGLNSIARIQSGTPLFFRSSVCNVPGQFQAACIPTILEGANPFAQSKSDFDPANGPLLNSAAFEDPASFNFYYGKGARVSNLRGFGYNNHDLTIFKRTQISEKLRFEFRAEFFNVWNMHVFRCTSRCFGDQGFDTDVASPTFGEWNGAVTAPRTIQLSGKLIF
jgi:hypothetical protein